MIPYVKDVLNQHSDDQEWVYWIFEKLIDHWNTKQVQQIQAELIKISQEKANDLSALRILLTHGIYAKDVVCEIIQHKKMSLYLNSRNFMILILKLIVKLFIKNS